MKNNYRKLGDYIQPVDVRNSDLKVSHLLGLSINKCFIESIANTIGTDFRPYKIVKKGQFAYGPVTSRNGEKITIALLEEPECIISSSYAVFEITDTSKLLPEYLMLWFSRPEFDRYARYKSHGSVREIFDWDEMCRVELPVPPLNEQQKIVDTYNAITNRIQIKQKINENLEKTAQCLFEEIYSNREDWNDGIISDLGEIIGGATPSTEVKEYFCDKGIPWLSPKDLTSTGYKYISKGETDITEEGYKSCSTKLMPKGTVLLTSRAPVGCLAIAENDICTNQGFKSLVPKKDIGTAYVYYFLKSEVDMLKQNASGTTFDEISGSVIKNLKCKIPPANIALDFNEKCKPIFNYQRTIENEIKELVELRQLVVSQISKR